MRAQLSFWCRSLCVVFCLMVLLPPAAAFDTLASDFAFSNLQRKLLDDRTATQPSPDLSAPDAVAAVRFTSDPSRTQSNLKDLVNDLPDAQAKADLERLIALQPSIITDIGAAMKSRYGLDPNNFADVYAAWWISAWLIAELQNSQPAPSTTKAVSAQVHAALLESSEFLNMDDAARQKTAETLLMQALLMSESALAARDDPALQEMIANAVKSSALQNGVDLTLVQLTPRGFELR